MSPFKKRHIQIGLIVEDTYGDAYSELIQKIDPDRVRSNLRKIKKTIPATRKLGVWIQELKGKFDFVFVLVDLDTPMHRKDPEYFQNLQMICQQEGAALLVVKRELESWLLADVESIARWKKIKKHALSTYHNTARDPSEPKKEIVKLVNSITSDKGRRKFHKFDPQWAVEIAGFMELNETTLSRNSSLRCFYDLVKGCCSDKGKEYFKSYPQNKHCNTQVIPK